MTIKESRRIFLKSSIHLTTAGLFAGTLSCQSKKSIRFGILTDSHFADREQAGTRFYKDSAEKMQHAVDFFKTEKVDFVIELGDFKDQDTPPEEAKTIQYLRTIEKTFKSFGGPIYHVLGNHDMDSLSKKQLLQNITNTNIPSDKSYYSFNKNGFHFVVLDANFQSDGSDYDHGNFDWTDANIPPAELAWLGEDLEKSNKPIIVFVHQLLDGEGLHRINNRENVRQILQRSNKIIAVFHGHKHDGDYSLIKKIHYITLQAMVEGQGLENNRYYVVEIDNNLGIKISGFGKAASAIYS